MRIICPKCGTEYFLESDQLDPEGTPVQCSACEHTFTVYGTSTRSALSQSSLSSVEADRSAGLDSSAHGADEPRSRPRQDSDPPPRPRGVSGVAGLPPDLQPPPPPVPAPATPAGLFLAQGDRIYKVKDAATLQRWIVEKRVLPGDRLSRDGKAWDVVSRVPEFQPFFTVIEQLKKAKRALKLQQAVAPGPTRDARRKSDDALALGGDPDSEHLPTERAEGPTSPGADTSEDTATQRAEAIDEELGSVFDPPDAPAQLATERAEDLAATERAEDLAATERAEDLAATERAWSPLDVGATRAMAKQPRAPSTGALGRGPSPAQASPLDVGPTRGMDAGPSVTPREDRALGAPPEEGGEFSGSAKEFFDLKPGEELERPPDTLDRIRNADWSSDSSVDTSADAETRTRMPGIDGPAAPRGVEHLGQDFFDRGERLSATHDDIAPVLDSDPDETFEEDEWHRVRRRRTRSRLALLVACLFLAGAGWYLGVGPGRDLEPVVNLLGARTSEPLPTPEPAPEPTAVAEASVEALALTDPGAAPAAALPRPTPKVTPRPTPRATPKAPARTDDTEQPSREQRELDKANQDYERRKAEERQKAQAKRKTERSPPRTTPTPRPSRKPEPNTSGASVDALMSKGAAARARGDFRAAASAFEGALAADPKNARAAISLGWMRIELGENGGAVEAFKAALKARASSAEAYYGLGLAYQARGQKSEAIAMYEKSLELDPDSRDAREVQAILRGLR